jgi:hypothetical protein
MAISTISEQFCGNFGEKSAVDAFVAEINEIGTDLSSNAAGKGASMIGLRDSAGTFAATDLESVLAEALTPVTLTVAAEAADNIAVSVQGPAHIAQYMCTVLAATGIPVAAAAFTVDEDGPGAEVFSGSTNNVPYIFTTDAAGQATLDIVDVASGSGATLQVFVQPLGASAGAGPGAAAYTTVTFD